jgi:prepilin-type N-terminal cleavage/methylation domain-containing protein
VQATTLLRRQHAFSLIELLVVIAIIGILLAIAVPSFLGYKDRANQKAADADIRSALPSIEALYVDDKSYSSLTLTKIHASYDADAKFAGHYLLPADKGQTYCVSVQVGTKWAWVQRGKSPTNNGDIQESTPPAQCQ